MRNALTDITNLIGPTAQRRTALKQKRGGSTKEVTSSSQECARLRRDSVRSDAGLWFVVNQTFIRETANLFQMMQSKERRNGARWHKEARNDRERLTSVSRSLDQQQTSRDHELKVRMFLINRLKCIRWLHKLCKDSFSAKSSSKDAELHDLQDSSVTIEESTLFLAMQLLDLALESCFSLCERTEKLKFVGEPTTQECKWKLLGSACLTIAAKFEEIYPPEFDDLIDEAGDIFTFYELETTERQVLNLLRFKVRVPTIESFAAYILQAMSDSLGRMPVLLKVIKLQISKLLFTITEMISIGKCNDLFSSQAFSGSATRTHKDSQLGFCIVMVAISHVLAEKYSMYKVNVTEISETVLRALTAVGINIFDSVTKQKTTKRARASKHTTGFPTIERQQKDGFKELRSCLQFVSIELESENGVKKQQGAKYRSSLTQCYVRRYSDMQEETPAMSLCNDSISASTEDYFSASNEAC